MGWLNIIDKIDKGVFWSHLVFFFLGYDDLDIVKEIDEEQLRELGITKKGHILKILRGC